MYKHITSNQFLALIAAFFTTAATCFIAGASMQFFPSLFEDQVSVSFSVSPFSILLFVIAVCAFAGFIFLSRLPHMHKHITSHQFIALIAALLTTGATCFTVAASYEFDPSMFEQPANVVLVSTSAASISSLPSMVAMAYAVAPAMPSLAMVSTADSAQRPADVDPSAEATQSTCIELKNNLRYRSRDAQTDGEVSLLQDFLASVGLLRSEPTGYLGMATFQAVKQLQSKAGLSPTGYVGPLTRDIVKKYSCAMGERKPMGGVLRPGQKEVQEKPRIETTRPPTVPVEHPATPEIPVTLSVPPVSVATVPQPTTDVAKAVIVPSSEDRAGVFNVFSTGGGTINRNPIDWKWAVRLTLPRDNMTIARITIVHAEKNAEVWSSGSSRFLRDSTDLVGSDKQIYPLVVLENNSQLNSKYNQKFGPYASGVHEFTVFGQPEALHFKGGQIYIECTDGTVIAGSIPASDYVPPAPEPTAQVGVVRMVQRVAIALSDLRTVAGLVLMAR